MSTERPFSHIVRDSGRMLHLEYIPTTKGLEYGARLGRANCGRSVARWNEKAAQVWNDNPDQRCSQCEGPLGPRAVLKS